MGPVKMNGIGGWNTVKHWFWLGSSLSVNNLYSDDFLFYMMFEWFVFVFNVLCFFGGSFQARNVSHCPTVEVKEVQHKGSKQRFAWKQVLSDSSPESEPEVQLLRNLRHQNIIQIHEVYSAPGVVDMVLELCTEGSMKRWLVWNQFSFDFLCFLSMKHQWNWRIIACRTAISANFCQHQVHAVTCGEMWWREHLLPTGQAWDCKVAFSAAVGREFPSSERGGASRHQTRCWVWSTENPCWSFCQGMLFWRFSVQEYPNISKHYMKQKKKLRIARKPRMLDRLAQSRCHFSDFFCLNIWVPSYYSIFPSFSLVLLWFISCAFLDQAALEDNVLLSGRTWKLADFNLACNFGSRTRKVMRSKAGTRPFMAPEVLEKGRPLEQSACTSLVAVAVAVV